MAGILPHDGAHLSTRALPPSRLPPARRLGAPQFRRHDGRDRRARLAHARADELAPARRRGDGDADAPAVLRGRAGGRAPRPLPPPTAPPADPAPPGPPPHRPRPAPPAPP